MRLDVRCSAALQTEGGSIRFGETMWIDQDVVEFHTHGVVEPHSMGQLRFSPASLNSAIMGHVIVESVDGGRHASDKARVRCRLVGFREEHKASFESWIADERGRSSLPKPADLSGRSRLRSAMRKATRQKPHSPRLRSPGVGEVILPPSAQPVDAWQDELDELSEVEAVAEVEAVSEVSHDPVSLGDVELEEAFAPIEQPFGDEELPENVDDENTALEELEEEPSSVSWVSTLTVKDGPVEAPHRAALTAKMDDLPEPEEGEDPQVVVQDEVVAIRWLTLDALRRDWDELRRGRVAVFLPLDEGRIDVRLVMPDGQAYLLKGRLAEHEGMPTLRVRLGVALRQKIMRSLDRG